MAHPSVVERGDLFDVEAEQDGLDPGPQSRKPLPLRGGKADFILPVEDWVGHQPSHCTGKWTLSARRTGLKYSSGKDKMNSANAIVKNGTRLSIEKANELRVADRAGASADCSWSRTGGAGGAARHPAAYPRDPSARPSVPGTRDRSSSRVGPRGPSRAWPPRRTVWQHQRPHPLE